MVERPSLLNSASGDKMDAVGEVVPGQHGGRPVLKTNGQTRIALPMAYLENCISQVESDFLCRFYEACEIYDGRLHLFDGEGEPMGRFARYADTVDPQSYARMEIEAYKWVRRYALGQEWATVAEVFLRMMTERAKLSPLDWGGLLTNSDDAKISLGGYQVSMKLLGIRLKDAYRDFFRYYRYVSECASRGEEPSGQGAYASLERDKRVARDIQRFKQAQGLLPAGTENCDDGEPV
jgi:hypothetical protein